MPRVVPSARASLDSSGESASVGSSPHTPTTSQDPESGFTPLWAHLQPTRSSQELEQSRLETLYNHPISFDERVAFRQALARASLHKRNMPGNIGPTPKDGSEYSQTVSPPSDRPMSLTSVQSPVAATGQYTGDLSTRDSQTGSDFRVPTASRSFLAPSVDSSKGASAIADSDCSSFASLPSEGSPPSLLTDRTDNTRSTNSSVETSIASAVSGVLGSETNVNEVNSHVPTRRYECWAKDALSCTDRVFECKDEWNTHCLAHFNKAGPPIRGSRCPQCNFRVGPEMIPSNTMALPLDYRSETEMKKRANEAETTPYLQDQSWRAQADYLWQRRQAHVARHYEHVSSSAAAQPDRDLYRYLWESGLISTPRYKDLSGPADRTHQGPDDGIYTSNVDSRRERCN